MSASSKKKLRKEQNAALLTEKQQKAQAEAKKLKITTIVFVAVVLAIVVTFAAILIVNFVKNSGVSEKNTVAATVGEHELSSVEMNYYYNDVISNSYNEWYNMYGDSMSTYLMLMGLDLTVPLDEQMYTMEEGEMTWADYFMDAALDRAKSDYALYEDAIANNHVLTEEEQTNLDNSIVNMNFYAQMYGFNNLDKYLKAMYGPGSSEKSYTEYSTRSAIATSYYNAHSDSLTYSAEDIDAYEAEKATDYNSYDYAYYYVNYTKFLPEAQQDDSGNTASYTDEQHAAARAEAKAAAESLLTATSIEELDTAIAALEINKESTSAASSKNSDTMGSAVADTYAEWVKDASRKENDIEMFTYETTTTDADGNEKTSVNGYYVVLFQGMTDNTRPVGNVRHLLVKFAGGTTENGETVYSDEEKAAAKDEADGYLKTWLDGEKTEESFIELVKEHSDDSSASEGGLFEDITPKSSFVKPFLDWSIDENRTVGDAEVIESEFGYHVMYYVGASELNYRDMMMSDDMRAEDLEEWYNGLTEAVDAALADTKHLDKSKVISPEG